MAPFRQTTLMAHEKHAGGRPSEYDPGYCLAVIEYMERGFSLTAFAGSIRKARTTVYEWIGEHREFADAVARGRAARVAALERKLLTARYGAQASTSMFALRNADPLEWRDLKHTQVDHNHRVESLTDAQLFAIASGKSLHDAGTIDGECIEVPQANER